jgi:hypothetical protein
LSRSRDSIYRGLLASDRIKSVTIDTRSDERSFNFDFDNVSRSAIVPAIPEPATWILVAVAVSLIQLHRRYLP